MRDAARAERGKGRVTTAVVAVVVGCVLAAIGIPFLVMKLIDLNDWGDE